jgi:Lon protease-like protein
MSTLEIPLFPLSTVLFPGGPLPLRVFEPRYLSMVSRCLQKNHGFGVVLIKSGAEVGDAEFYGIGTVADIVDWYQGSDGLLGVSAEGRERFTVLIFERQADGLYVGKVELRERESSCSLPDEYRYLSELLKHLLDDLGGQYNRIPKIYDDASWVGFRLAEILPLPVSTRQELLEISDPRRRLELLQPHLGELSSNLN